MRLMQRNDKAQEDPREHGTPDTYLDKPALDVVVDGLVEWLPREGEPACVKNHEHDRRQDPCEIKVHRSNILFQASDLKIYFFSSFLHTPGIIVEPG